MYDIIEVKENLNIHHGKVNNRLYLMNAKTSNWSQTIDTLQNIANSNGYNKIISRVPESAKDSFLSKNFKIEATVPGLYNGKEEGYFFADYNENERGIIEDKKLKVIESVKTIALAAKKDPSEQKLPQGFELRELDTSDIENILRLNHKVFSSYPFPIFDRTYLEKCIKEEFDFYGIFKDDELKVYSYIKKDLQNKFIEIIDFATHPSYRGKNLSQHLVSKIIDEATKQDIHTILCLVRSTSYGLNIMLRKNEFVLGGTLNNNTLIDTSLQSVNVWYRKI